MSVINNVTDLLSPARTSPSITLDSVVKAMEQWRAQKRNRGEPLPESIWQQIFALTGQFSESTLRSALCISNNQFSKRLEEHRQMIKPQGEFPAIDFCEVKTSKEPKSNLYNPAKIPATNTLVVEFCRADGRIMKIHTTTDSFAELMTAFFARSES